MKRPFDIDLAFDRIEKAIRPFPKAALFELAEEGYRSPFELLVACILSIRTRDEVSIVCARRLLGLARTPALMRELSPAQIDAAIVPCTFHETKAVQIREIARTAAMQPGEVLPCDADFLLSLKGVGPKCANLVLGIACGQPRVGVDVHVHRVTNRWGYVHEKTPERTMTALEARLPGDYWVDINRLLVPFGKHICTGILPRCSTCPVLDMCQQQGVGKHR